MRTSAGLRTTDRSALTWSLAAAALGGGLLLAERSRGPLDDVDAAHQRDGLVVDLGPVDLSPHLAARTPAAVLFVRPGMVEQLAGTLSAPDGPDLPGAVRLLVAQPGPPPSERHDLHVIDDASGAVRRACRMRDTRDGGYPVGFAVVDAAGHLRYRTLDPGMTRRWFELRTMVRAVVR